MCMLPGTEIEFEKTARRKAAFFTRSVKSKLARFRQINTDRLDTHHDALEFANGAIVLVTDLAPDQKATVVQLPAVASPSRPNTSTSAIALENSGGALQHDSHS
ncbi:MAG: hypothetical protein P4L81_01925 [Candidatus Pacebacteria bacterium]|nr:hypothetical protein [Candidatus Paceibacterota bacterium]